MTINERVSPETLDKIIEAADEVITALAGTNEDVHKNDSAKMCQLWDDLNDRYATPAIVKAMARELQQYRAAAKPACYALTNSAGEVYNTHSSPENADAYRWLIHQSDDSLTLSVTPLYAAPQVTSVPEIAARLVDTYLLNEGTDSEFIACYTISKNDRISEKGKQIWADWRALSAALKSSQTAPAVQAGQEPIYQLRDVDWYDTDKRTYDTVVNTGGAGRIVYAAPQLPQPAVVPDAIEIDDDFDSAFEHGKAVGWNAYRAAMLQGAEPVSQPYTLPEHSPCADAPDHIWLQTAGEWPASGEFGELTWSCDNQHPDDTLYVRADLVGNFPCYLQGYKDGCEWSALMAEANHPQTGDWLFDDPIELAKAIRKGPDMLPAEPGNSPAIPDGYALVPIRLTAENGAKELLSGEFSETKFISCPECFGDDECETCDGSGRIEITVPVSWTTIKEIWAKGVEHFAAAPKQEAE